MRRARLAAVALTGVILAVGCSATVPASPGSSSLAAPTEPAAAPVVSPTPNPVRSASPATRPPSPPASATPARSVGRPQNPAWARLDPATALAPREDHTWTVDPSGKAAWLFGGRDGATVFDDLWRYDLVTDAWSPVDAAGEAPEGRFGHAAGWIDGVGLVVWSGQAGSAFFDDLWAFDPDTATWRQLPAPGGRPAARYGSCAAVAADDRLWVSHGFTADNGRFADTWAYDFSGERWTETTPAGDLPVARCLHDCLWTPDGRLVLYAGQTTGVAAIGDLWSVAPGAAWDPAPAAPGETPPARQLYALAVEGSTGWIFGGGGIDGSKLADLWALNLDALAWQQVLTDGDRPAGRSGATLVADAARHRLLLFGGLTQSGPSAETWMLASGG